MAESVKLYKSLILSVKVIPMIIAAINFINIILSYFGIEFLILNYLAGISIFTLVYLYLASYALKFCEYHRIFLHYILITNIINSIDYYYGIPINNKEFIMLHILLVIVFMFIILFLKQKKI